MQNKTTHPLYKSSFLPPKRAQICLQSLRGNLFTQVTFLYPPQTDCLLKWQTIVIPESLASNGQNKLCISEHFWQSNCILLTLNHTRKQISNSEGEKPTTQCLR